MFHGQRIRPIVARIGITIVRQYEIERTDLTDPRIHGAMKEPDHTYRDHPTAALAQELPAGLAAVALNPGIIDTRMLRSCFGEEAGSYPLPEEWAKVAVPYLASLGTRHNGQALTVPGM